MSTHLEDKFESIEQDIDSIILALPDDKPKYHWSNFILFTAIFIVIITSVAFGALIIGPGLVNDTCPEPDVITINEPVVEKVDCYHVTYQGEKLGCKDGLYVPKR